MSYTQTLKSASQPRVTTGITENQAGARMAGHYSALCIAGATDLQNDIYGRNVGSLGVDMRGAPECNSFMPHGQSMADHITRENLERPYVTIGPEGTRGVADLMGKGRDIVPQDLYGTGLRGNFIRHSYPGLTLPNMMMQNALPPIHRVEQNAGYPTTHDTTSNYIYRG